MKKLKHSWGVEFSNFFEKRGSSDFSSHKNGRVGKIGGFVLKKGGVSLIFITANPFQCYLSLSAWCVCVLFIYTISISIICASQEEPSLIATNQQIYDIYK